MKTEDIWAGVRRESERFMKRADEQLRNIEQMKTLRKVHKIQSPSASKNQIIEIHVHLHSEQLSPTGHNSFRYNLFKPS